MRTNRPCSYSAGILASFLSIATAVAQADDAPIKPAEAALLAVLRSDAPADQKALTCKRLAIDGSSAAVADLAPLLHDPQLASWARIALEAIPGPAADAALRQAAESLEGRLLVGTLNSIGVRRDANAVALLTAQLQKPDADAASAAAVALGRIGNAAALTVLRDSLTNDAAKVRSAVAEGCVLCAERLVADGKQADAVALYDQVRGADVPTQRVIEATRGAILARNEAGIPLLLEQFRSADKRFFQLALMTARDFPGGAVDDALAEELGRATPERAARLVHAMADREETVVLAAILKAAVQGPQPVRLAAIDALARIGDATCLPALLAIAIEPDAALATTAKATLANLKGRDVDAQVVALLPTAAGKSYPLLIELVGERRIDAVPALLKALEHADQAVRAAALTSLGETVSLDKLDVLVTQVVAPKHPADAAVAEQALRAASVRMPDREACAEKLSLKLAGTTAETKSVLLEILADVGGSKALTTLAAAAKSDDPQQQDTGSRLLGKWNGVEAAPVLLDLAENAPENKYRVRALRGYIGLARKFAMPAPERAKMCQQAFDAAQRPDEQVLVLEVLKIHPSAAALALAIKAIEVAEIKDEATQAALVIAQKVGGKGVDVTQLLKGAGLAKVKLEIIKAEYGSGSTQQDVTSFVRKHAGSLPLITLGSPSYNASFGGDPAPGIVKRLKIQYRINGKDGEASFAENALIVLPIPK